MNTPNPQGEDRPADTVEYPSPIPLVRLRSRERTVIPPEACLLGPGCLVCRWRREGLLDLPVPRAA